MRPRLALALLLVLAFALPVAAQEGECPEYRGLTCEGWVTDSAGVLSDRDRLEATAGRFVEDVGHEIAVVTVQGTAPLQPREFAEELGNTWGVGDPQDNDGIVVLVALDERRTEIVTGPGAELSGSVLDDIASLGDDFFAGGDFDAGLTSILTGLRQAYTGSGTDGQPAPAGETGGGPGWVVPIVGFSVIVLAAGGAFLVVRRNNRQERLAEHRRVVDGLLARLE
ncbi:MAG: TPM domain-containing protein, partial [Actinomycetota bacterium]